MLDTGIVIISPGRTGSTLIEMNLNEYYQHTVTVLKNTSNPFLVPLNNKKICILSKRKSILDSFISAEIANVTKEFSSYTNKVIEPFILELHKLRNNYVFVNVFYQFVDLSKFDVVYEMWYNELIMNSLYLFSQLGIEKETNYSAIPKSPYNKENLILNLEEITEYYNSLSPDQISQDEVFHTKKNLLENCNVYNGPNSIV